LQNWKKKYLTPGSINPETEEIIRGLYTPSDITPYIHSLVGHLPSMIRLCLTQGLQFGWFSASGQEKKNHLQVNYFDRKTLKGGASSEPEKDVLMQEGRKILFFSKYSKDLKKNDFNVHHCLKCDKPIHVFINKKPH